MIYFSFDCGWLNWLIFVKRSSTWLVTRDSCAGDNTLHTEAEDAVKLCTSPKLSWLSQSEPEPKLITSWLPSSAAPPSPALAMAETHSLTPMYASQSHNYSFNFCCKVSGNQTLFFNNLKKTKVLLTKVKTRSELYYRADRTDESLQLSVGIQFQSYLPLLSFVQISPNFWNLVLVFTWVVFSVALSVCL